VLEYRVVAVLELAVNQGCRQTPQKVKILKTIIMMNKTGGYPS
jgi:hypothetical protein